MSLAGHKATSAGDQTNVCFTSKNGHPQVSSACPFRANSGLMRRSKSVLFDQFVRAGKDARRQLKAERLSGLEIDG
jgi:hypothetical protein